MKAVDDYTRFVTLFYKLTDIDLAAYKRTQMERRLRSLSYKHGMKDMEDYARKLALYPELLLECLEKMTINVTSFYRNIDRWKTFEELLSAIYQREKKPLRIWSSACSTGEEPYTVAMICKENEIELVHNAILATDIDEAILKKARAGIYGLQSLVDMSEELKQRYFHSSESMYTLTTEIRNLVDYRKLDLISDPYPATCDIILCRNVCIYFTEETKQHIFIKLSGALKKGGILFVGSTEQIFNPAKYGLKAVAPFFYEKSV